MSNYFELHNHSHFSWLDGVSNPKEMAKRAKELGYPAIALTDHGEIAGWWEFSKACTENGVMPIFSCEFYIARDMNDQEDNPFKAGEKRCKRGHLIVHAKGQDGIEAVRSLYNKSWENYTAQGNKQIIFEADLFSWAGKILVQSACTGSYITDEDKVQRFKDTFGDDFYLEIQPHKLDYDYDMVTQKFIEGPCKQLNHNCKILEWAEKYDVNLIVTNDSHYVTQTDKVLQDILILNSYVGQKTGWHFKQDTNHLVEKELWWQRFEENHPALVPAFTRERFEKALDLMQGIVEKCKGATLQKKPVLRRFPLQTHPLYKEGDTKESLILRIIQDVGRYKKDAKYIERFKYEFKIIKDKDFLDYFLIQEDIIRWNRTGKGGRANKDEINNFLVGPARGSAAGSLLSFYMDITKIDPIKYDLLFERFLDIDRTDFPDIDTDYEMKEETFEYVAEKYGREFVMAIGAYQTMKVKSAIKNAYRILYKDRNYDYNMINEVTKQFKESNAREEGNQYDIFKDALIASKKEHDLCIEKQVKVPANNLYVFIKDKPDLIKALANLLGKVTNMRVHPCSIVITPEDSPVRSVLPVTTTSSGKKDEKWVTALDGGAVEAAGQIKFDILALNTLNCISACLDEIIKYKGPILENGIDISDKNNIWEFGYKIDPEDPKVLARTADGDTETVFQVLQPLPRRVCMDMRVSSFNDWVATIAIIRPGPLKAMFDKIYVDRKFGKINWDTIYISEEDERGRRIKPAPAKYSHPLLNDKILKDTYGVFAYQEQVQKTFIEIGGFTPIESNKIRKAISKGKKSLFEPSKPQFMEYATKKLTPAWTTAEVDAFYDDMLGFGSYCFNKSHSVAYALLGYVCQYLKVYYPLEWWSGNLKHSGEKGSEGILKIIQENQYVPIKTVDINQSKEDFYFNGTDIIMPLKHIDGVGESGLPKIVAGQPFTSLEDFVKRMPGRSVRKNCVVNLVVTGAFKSIEPNKSPKQLIAEFFLDIKKEKQIPDEYQAIIDDEGAWERYKSSIDPFYVSDWVNKFRAMFDPKVTPIGKLAEYSEGANVFIGGEISKVTFNTVKNGKNAGQKMAYITVRELNASIKITLWPDQVKHYQQLLEDNPVGKLIEVNGKTSIYNGNLQLSCTTMKEVLIG